MRSEGERPAEPAASAPWLIPALVSSAFVSVLSHSALAPFLPLISDAFGVGVALLGQIPTVAMLLAAGLGLVLGPLADQYGPHRTLLIGLLTLVVSALGAAIAPNATMLLLALLIGAIGRAVVQPVAQSIAGARFTGQRRRQVISWTTGGASGAPILGIPLLTATAALLDWRAAFVALALLALVTLVLLWRVLGPDTAVSSSRPHPSVVLAAYRPLLRYRPALALVGSSLCGNASLFVLYTYLGAFYVQQLGFGIQEVGWAFLASGLGLMVGMVLVGPRLGQAPLRPLLAATRGVGGALMAAALLLPLAPLVVVGLLVANSLLVGLSVIATVLLLTQETPGGRATTLTLNGSAFSVGIALGSALGGVLLVAGDYPALGYGVLALSLLSSGLAWWSSPRASERAVAQKAAVDGRRGPAGAPGD